jgi:drug/metabolite transporter (DMT)-like permease
VIGRYAAGVAAALAAGAAYNVGQLAQKVAVNRLGAAPVGEAGLRSAGFVAGLLRSPLWLVGFAVVAFVGTPLNILAAAWLGPAILPGLMSLGLVVLALGAVTIVGERLGAADVAGIALVMAGIALIGLSRLAVDVSSADLHSPALLGRLAAFTAATTALGAAGLTFGAGPGARGARGPLRALASGLFFAASNLWLAEFLNAAGPWLSGIPLREGLGLAATALGVMIASSGLGIVSTQYAYKVGDASRMVPIQMVPAQVVPIAAFVLVFRGAAPSAAAIPLAAGGAALVLAGAGLLAGRHASARNVTM